METIRRQDKALLLSTANEIVSRLRGRTEGTCLRIRRPRKAHKVSSYGWLAMIGDVGAAKPRLEIWFDRFSGFPDRKLWVGFRSRDAKPIGALVRKELWPIRKLTELDLDMDEAGSVLKHKLGKNEFNAPVLENYDRWRDHFFGFYDPTRATQATTDFQFCERAVAFVLDVVRSLPPPATEDVAGEVYPQCENRRLVAAHLARERSRLLAADCKRRDGYRCQVCGMKFSEVYGEDIAGNFAEAHHIEPLSQLPDQVKTKLEDLITVCANCHRMLHRMGGGPDDVRKLRTTVRRSLAKKN